MACKYDPIDEPRLFSGGRDYSEVPSAFDDGGTGIHYDTAHTACAILANNRWDGYFSHDKHGRLKAQPLDGILRNEQYYFCLPSSDPLTDSYPVIPRFRDWRFPHGDLPPIWKKLKDQLRAKGPGDKSKGANCLLSNCGDAVESAYLVPSAQSYWWTINLMKRYAKTPSFSTNDMDVPANALPLRCDIHKMFDERHFTFVPKTVIYRFQRRATLLSQDDAGHRDQDLSSPGDSKLRADNDGPSQADLQLPIRLNAGSESHNAENELKADPVDVVGHVFNSTPSGDLPRLWHNRALCSPPSSASVEYLFARFAYTVFSPSVFKYFLDSNKARRLLVWDQEKLKQEIEEADPEKCRSIWNASRSRSESPKKRARSTGNGEYDEGGDFASETSTLNEPERGRRRKRKSEEYSETNDLYGVKRSRLDC
ncbi:hypothetical protein BGZ61DRAFT_469186 [Ilyonectria robusta]|uniref:uncharacterized protein n=1 Tax=Ilyonectria robusta TaxID=1079257 RepID=UPI001E8E41AC|nr:uncharacterized protein BGZ61DRAFT_469186 [Ilyonectria robusta]KAH8650750.1 hypothetical protein BGZ61DRAFT_469186 [Ilyonectria robusta]